MKDQFMMDSHKLLWHLDRVSQWQKGERIVPLHIDMGITTGCNMACAYCYGVIQGRTNLTKRFDMPSKQLNRFLREAKQIGVRSIAFIGEGENTLNSALYDALSCAGEIGLDVSLATNGIAIQEDRIHDMLKNLVWLRFNISAATNESFKKIHKVNEFDRVIGNIRRCTDIKRKYDLDVTIGMQMVVIQDNMDQIVPLARLGRELGVDYLVVKSCSDTIDKTLDAPVEEYLDIESVLKEAENLSTADYAVLIKWQKMRNLGLKNFRVCHGTQFLIAISGDGTVFPCGHFFNIRRDEFAMGNIIEMSFKDIVYSDRYLEVQKKVQGLDVNIDCETNCRQYYINQFLWKLKNPPDHVNFI